MLNLKLSFTTFKIRRIQQQSTKNAAKKQLQQINQSENIWPVKNREANVAKNQT